MPEFKVICPGCQATIRYSKPRREIICPKCKTRFATSMPTSAPAASPQLQAPAEPLDAQGFPGPLAADPLMQSPVRDPLAQQPMQQQPIQPQVMPQQPMPQQPMQQQPMQQQPMNAMGQPVPGGPGFAAPVSADNPYQSPMAMGPAMAQPVVSTGGLFRDGKKLVVDKNATLPDVCLKSSQPAASRVKQKFSWCNPIWYIIGGALLAIIFTKRATLQIPLSDEWMARRRKRIIVTWVLALSSVGSFVLGMALLMERSTENIGGILMCLALLSFFAALLWAILFGKVIKSSMVTDTHVWLTGVDQDYLNQLPAWQG